MRTAGDMFYREKAAKADSSGMQTGREVIKVGQEGSFRGIRINAIPSKSSGKKFAGRHGQVTNSEMCERSCRKEVWTFMLISSPKLQ